MGIEIIYILLLTRHIKLHFNTFLQKHLQVLVCYIIRPYQNGTRSSNPSKSNGMQLDISFVDIKHTCDLHYSDVIMGAMASQITNLTTVYSTVYSGAAHRKYQSSASLAFVRGIHRWSVNSPHKGPVTRKMFPFDDVIMATSKSKLQRSWHWWSLPGIIRRSQARSG